jgi:hypothetical protein
MVNEWRATDGADLLDLRVDLHVGKEKEWIRQAQERAEQETENVTS